jgi:hypothetical protein
MWVHIRFTFFVSAPQLRVGMPCGKQAVRIVIAGSFSTVNEAATKPPKATLPES